MEDVEEEVQEYSSASVQFVADVSLPDRSVLPAGHIVKKIWSVKNSGKTEWPAGSRLVYYAGAISPLENSNNILVPVAKPGEIVNIHVNIVVPHVPRPGTQVHAFWKVLMLILFFPFKYFRLLQILGYGPIFAS